MTGSDWEAVLDVRKWSGVLTDVRKWSGGSPGCLGVVERPSWMCGRFPRFSESGREALLDDREWSTDLPG